MSGPKPLHPSDPIDDDTPTAAIPIVRPRDPVTPPRPRPAPATGEQDSSGRALALRLPEWDLLPPTEFVQRRAR